MADSEFYLEMGFVSYVAYLNFHNPLEIERVDINDIVWAQCGSLYWPAVLTDIYEEGILNLWFVHNPYESVQRPVTEVMAFLDLEEIRDEAIASNCVETFDKIKEIAMQYMSRKSEGHQEDPLQFFLSVNSDVLTKMYETYYQEALKELSSESESGEEIGVARQVQVLEGIQEDSKMGPHFEEYYNEGEVPYEAEARGQAVECDEVKEVLVEQNYGIQHIELLSDVKDKEMTDLCFSPSLEFTSPAPLTMESSYVKQLVSHIMYGSVKYYLVQLLKGEKSSFYYELYKKCMKTFTTQKLTKISYEPICAVETLREIIPYLVTGYRNILERLPESVPVPECESYFIAAVWLPEAMVCAISCFNDISLYDAYEVFIQSSALRGDYIRYFEEYCMGSAVPLPKMSEDLDGPPPNDDYCGPSTPLPSLKFFYALEIVNDMVFVDKVVCKPYFTKREEMIPKLQDERSKTRE